MLAVVNLHGARVYVGRQGIIGIIELGQLHTERLGWLILGTHPGGHHGRTGGETTQLEETTAIDNQR
jgi:hypothetical protein